MIYLLQLQQVQQHYLVDQDQEGVEFEAEAEAGAEAETEAEKAPEKSGAEAETEAEAESLAEEEVNQKFAEVQHLQLILRLPL